MTLHTRDFINKHLWERCRTWVRYTTHMAHIWEGLWDVIGKLLQRGSSVKLGDLGVLEVVKVPERKRSFHVIGKGSEVRTIPAHRRLRFKPSKKWRRL